jgi:hypothetical protein
VNSIQAVFGEAGVELEKYIRTMNFWYIYHDFAGLFPNPRWGTVKLINDGISEDVRTFPLKFGEQLTDFICGDEDEDLLNEEQLPNDQLTETTSLFEGVCSARHARIAFRYFLVFRHVTRKGKKYICVTIFSWLHIFTLIYLNNQIYTLGVLLLY